MESRWRAKRRMVCGSCGASCRASCVRMGCLPSSTCPVPAAARYLVLFATAGEGPADNRISSDHAVFSGARLEFSTDSASVLQPVVSRELKIYGEAARHFGVSSRLAPGAAGGSAGEVGPAGSRPIYPSRT